MTRSIVRALAVCGFLSVGCSSDGTAGPPAGARDAGAGGAGGTTTHVDGSSGAAGAAGASGAAGADSGDAGRVAYGDCSQKNWSTKSAACWSCACGICADTLNFCGPECLADLQCALDNHTLVGVAADGACEVRATLLTCLTTRTAQSGAKALTDFDGCLLSHGTPGVDGSTGHLRACEKECGIVYTGDVCTRFP